MELMLYKQIHKRNPRNSILMKNMTGNNAGKRDSKSWRWICELGSLLTEVDTLNISRYATSLHH